MRSFPRTRFELTCRMAVLVSVLTAASCGGGGGRDAGGSREFALRFAAVAGGDEVGCGDKVSGFGDSGTAAVEVSDLRFYVSNVRFFTANGAEVPVELDENAFQYTGEAGSVALVDLTATDTGACAGTGLTFAEGTARTNSVLTGTTTNAPISRVTFDVGIPQPLMKQVLNDNTAEGAPSPLAEMHWSWAFAYRFFVMNFTVEDGSAIGEGYLHVGSTDCGGDGTRALTDRDACGKPNAAAVSLSNFDLDTDSIVVDLRALLANLDFSVSTPEATVLGVECHSSAEQPDCPLIFGNFGLDPATGEAAVDLNTVFAVR